MCEFHGVVLSIYTLLGFNIFRNLVGYLPIDSFVHHGEYGFLSTLFQRGAL